MSSEKTAVVRSYAKVNLSLDVLGKRPDGYHAIESVMQTISLHDTLTLTLGKPGIRVTCDMPGIPTDESNLVYRAAALFFARVGIEPALDIHIEKRIPPEAGLGGGSSNAAAVLSVLASDRSPFIVHRSLLPELAAVVGSDVPFFLVGGTALVRGRGEIVEALPDLKPWWLVIVKPPFGVSTAWAYQRLDEMEAPGKQMTASERIRNCIEKDGVSAELDTGCRELPRLLSNDLELPAVERHPKIGYIKEVLIEAGASRALMCGSGSAVFGLFESEESARSTSTRVADLGRVFVERTVGRQESMGVWECGCVGE